MTWIPGDQMLPNFDGALSGLPLLSIARIAAVLLHPKRAATRVTIDSARGRS